MRRMLAGVGAVALLAAALLPAEVRAEASAPAAEAPLAGSPPPLDMRAFGDRGRYRHGRATITIRLQLQTKLVGPVFWRDRDVYVLPDNAYARWLVADEMDYYFGRSKTWRLDPKIDECCLRSGHTDSEGNAYVDGLPPGDYLLFVGVYTNSGASRDVFSAVDGRDASGNAVQARIPDLAFPDKTIEVLYVLTPFSIGPDTRTLAVPLQVVADRVVPG